jgi:hypothetical protein
MFAVERRDVGIDAPRCGAHSPDALAQLPNDRGHEYQPPRDIHLRRLFRWPTRKSAPS